MDIKEYKEKPPDLAEAIRIAAEFWDKLESNQVDMPPEIAKLIDEHFWELF